MVNSEKLLFELMKAQGYKIRPDAQVDTFEGTKMPVILYKFMGGRDVRNLKRKAIIVPVIFTIISDDPEQANSLAYELYEVVRDLCFTEPITNLGSCAQSSAVTPIQTSFAKYGSKTLIQYTITATLSLRNKSKE